MICPCCRLLIVSLNQHVTDAQEGFAIFNNKLIRLRRQLLKRVKGGHRLYALYIRTRGTDICYY